MSGASFRFDDGGIGQAIAAARDKAGDLSDEMNEIGSTLVSRTQHRFATGRGPDGTPWKPLARSTLRKRAAKGATSPKILDDDGYLKSRITYVAGTHDVAVGTNMIYGGIHQFGGRLERAAGTQRIYRRMAGHVIGNRFVKKSEVGAKASDHARGAYTIDIPARPFLGLASEDVEDIEAILMRAIQRALGGAAS